MVMSLESCAVHSILVTPVTYQLGACPRCQAPVDPRLDVRMPCLRRAGLAKSAQSGYPVAPTTAELSSPS